MLGTLPYIITSCLCKYQLPHASICQPYPRQFPMSVCWDEALINYSGSYTLWTANFMQISTNIYCQWVTALTIKTQVWYFMPKQARPSNIPIPPGSHSQLVSGPLGITSSCSLLVFHCRSDSHRHIYVASASRYIELITVLDYSL